MIHINVGEIYSCDRFRSGVSEKGRWEVVSVIEEARFGKTKQEVTIFPATRPSGLYENCLFRVNRILGVARKKKKDREGNWTLTDVCIDADVELIEKGTVNVDGDLPFSFDGYDDDDDLNVGSLDGIL